MTMLRIPECAWNWRSSALLLVLLVAAQLWVLQLAPHALDLVAVADARALVTSVVSLAAAVLVYAYRRHSSGGAAAWIALLLTIEAVQGLTLTGLAITDPGLLARQASWVVLAQVVVEVVLVGLVLAAGRLELRVDPVVLGAGLGAVLSLGRYLVLERAPSLAPSDLVVAVVVACSVLLALLLAWGIVALDGLPAWGRTRLAVATVLLAGPGAASLQLEVFGAPVLAVSIGCGVVGTVLLAGTTLGLLRSALAEDRAALDHLAQRLASVEAGHRQDRARLHEIDATVAGIASASRLIQDDGPALTVQRRHVLQDMVQAEVARLQRLLDPHEAQERGVVDLDDIIGQLVMAHRARGRTVAWEPAGVRVEGRADDLAEVVNVLLDNAAKHGTAAGTRVEVGQAGGTVRIAVSDSGPGVSPEVRERLFEWGARGPDSGGQGIGLHIAHQLVSDLGGTLDLEDPAVGGARFVVALPAAARAADGVRHGSAAVGAR